MNKHTSALILSLVILLALFLYGCSNSGSGISVKPQGDTVITSREVIIDELGRLPTVTFPSGAKIEGLEENTLTSGIVVTLTEQKTTYRNLAYFNDYKPVSVSLYKITGLQSFQDPLSHKTYVTTTEKPLKITLPKNSNSQGVTLAGIKESDTDPWRFFNFSDSNVILANISGLRAVGANTAENTFNLFRLGTQFALVSYGGTTGNKLPEAYVTSLIASSTPSILVKDGKYSEDLTIKGILKGVKLDSIKPTDLKARITYRNNKADNAPIKVNGSNVTQTSKADKTVPGYIYYHSFEIDSVSESSMMGSNGEFAFTLNLDGIETQSFSNGFLIEFFNKVDSEKVMPYNYTEFYTVNQVGVYNIAYDLDGGILAEQNPTTYTEESETFVLNEPVKEGYTFIGWTGSNGNVPQKPLSIVQGSKSDLSFKANYEPISQITTYTITYNLDGGEVATANPTTYGEASETFVLNEPTKEGYTFIGWTGSNDNAPEKPMAVVQGSKSDLSFVANYAPIAYDIEYVLNNGILPQGLTNPTSYDITSATITLNNPTKDGYTFTGWSGTGLTGNNNMTVTIEQGSTGDRTYTANWSEVAYVITYNLDGGEVTTQNPTGYNTASETFVLNEPTKEGYTFLGWTGSNGNTPEKPLSIVQGSMTDLSFTANWSINSYRLDLVKGTGINTVTGDGLHEYNSVVTASCTMLEGYEFASWSGELTTETFNMPASNATMTANARLISYNIVYNLNGGTADNPTSYDITSATIVLNEPAQEGYTFLGWTGSNGNTPEKPLSIVQGSKSDLSFTANWSINSYRLDLVKGTGINTVTGDGLHEYNSVVTASCTMLAGYEFANWSGDFTTETFNMPASNATMTANARLISYNITYDLAGGALPAGLTNPATYDITSATITLNNPTKEGIYFMGWTSDEFFGASMSVKIPQGSTGNKTFTANWGEILTFNLPNDLTLVMHKIPAGVFNMGSPTDELGRSSNETLHQVTLTKAFYIGSLEVTQDQYFAIMNTNPSNFKEEAGVGVRPTTSANYPVEQVSYNDITTVNTGFLAQINSQLASQLPAGYKFDLPTEAQWEYACRAGTTTALNNGKNLIYTGDLDSNLSEVAWYKQNWGQINSKTHTIGEKLPNAWGLYDMHGNVWEWCKDWYNSSYYTTCGDCSDPVGPDTGSNRVLRGGSWCVSPFSCRSACRSGDTTTSMDYYLGFRLVLVAVP